jgi:hypothetical protein
MTPRLELAAEKTPGFNTDPAACFARAVCLVSRLYRQTLGRTRKRSYRGSPGTPHRIQRHTRAERGGKLVSPSLRRMSYARLLFLMARTILPLLQL